jgi:hypothetical protein
LKDSHADFETTTFLIGDALAVLDSIRASLTVLDASRFPCAIGEDSALIGKRRNHSGRDSMEFDRRLFSLLSFMSAQVSMDEPPRTTAVVKWKLSKFFFVLSIPTVRTFGIFRTEASGIL